MTGTSLNSSLNEPVLISLVNEWGYISLHLQAVTFFSVIWGSISVWISFLKEKKKTVKWECLYIKCNLLCLHITICPGTEMHT